MNIGTTEIILIFSLLMIIGFVVAMIFVVKATLKTRNQMKKCSFCAELIQPEAIVCRFCGRDLSTK